jgi:hypothetical protein
MSLVDITWEGSLQWKNIKINTGCPIWGVQRKDMRQENLELDMAHSPTVTEATEWTRISQPVLSPDDQDSRWFEKGTIFKSTVIRDKEKLTGHPFVMYYNARGDTARYESIGMAVFR